MASDLVEGATSDVLCGPDWGLNIELCDIVNDDPSQAKDVLKAVKKRLGNKNSKVQILALVLLETLIKNSGDNIHLQVIERGILHEMVKVVKKKPDLEIQEKILVLLHEWKEVLRGPKGKFPQYNEAYQDLVRAGVKFPQNLDRSAVILETQDTQPITLNPQSSASPNYGSEVVEATAASSLPGLNLMEIQKARSTVDVLMEMLNALDPRNKEGVKEEIIMDLVEQCSFNKQRAMQLVITTSDEELLCQGLALNDELQCVLGKHDAIASGCYEFSEDITVSVPHLVNIDQERDEEEDDVGQLFRRSSRIHTQSKREASMRNQPSTQSSLIPTLPGLKISVPLTETIDTLDLPCDGDVHESPSSETLLSPVRSTQSLSVHAIPNREPMSQGFSTREEQHSSSQSQDETQAHSNGSTLISVIRRTQHDGNQKNLHNHEHNGHADQAGESKRNIPDVQKKDPRYSAKSNNLKAQANKFASSFPTPQIEDSFQGPRDKIAMPAIPPPPSKYSERQKFFQQQKALASGQLNQAHSKAANNALTGMMHNLSLGNGSCIANNKEVVFGNLGNLSKTNNKESI